MNVTKEKAAENRENLLIEAARLFRERGISGVGVDALAQAANMTHGSLYSHFGSKDKVLAESLTRGFDKIIARRATLENISEVIDLYVSSAHRDNPGAGCFIPTLGSEIPRQSTEVRARFTEIVKRSMDLLGSMLPGKRKRQREDEALPIFATMIGTIILSRAVDDEKLSDRILSVNREYLLQQQKSQSRQST